MFVSTDVPKLLEVDEPVDASSFDSVDDPSLGNAERVLVRRGLVVFRPKSVSVAFSNSGPGWRFRDIIFQETFEMMKHRYGNHSHPSNRAERNRSETTRAIA